MEKSPSKININAQLIIIIVLVFFCGTLFILRNGEKTERAKVQKKLVETLKEKDEAQKNLADLKVAKSDLEAKIAAMESDIKKINEALSKEKEEKNSIKTNLDAKEAMLADLNAQLENEKREKDALNDSLAKFRKDYENLKSQVDQLTKTKQDLEAKLKEFSEASAPSAKESGVELEKIVVSAESKLKGDVVVVNKNLGFLVINLGSKDGISPGTILGIYRNDSFLGEVQVEKVYESISSANILPEWKGVAFKEGDKATVME